ncbi:LuxR C-terminal-related transcriptional regulator [Actinomadura gamaensis]|uniref:LuxR C-terminal-related transcriptional regulator n=1 Tax=Actinomadura gamaensis TaxID=1763541 RepID=A0ABV9TZ89_9ACTN
MTKVRAPEPRDEWISRSRLVHRLIDARSQRLVVVAAPAGYGKTALATLWRTDPDETRRCAWVTLDAGDNDPPLLWASILRALAQSAAVTGTEAAAHALEDRTAEIGDAFLGEIVNRLAEHGDGVVLVLDDCHRVRDADCVRQLEALITRLPADSQVILLTRTAPPLPLARFRASGDLVELGPDDLRFTAEETGRSVRRIGNAQLCDDVLDVLVERTEGWPAGVQFAARGMRGHRDPAAFVRAFDGSHRYVMDYFCEEVLAPLPDELYRFAVRLSVLDSFCAPLAAAVTHDASAGALIAEMTQANLFVVPLDDTRRWYRYHRLFRDVLHRLLTSDEPPVAPLLHRRASGWHEQHGRIGAAVEHALAAGDPDRAVGAVTAHWATLAFATDAPAPDGDGSTTLERWAASVGPERLAEDPVAALCAAWIAALAGDHALSARRLETARGLGHTGPLPDGAATLESSAAMLESTLGTAGAHGMLASARTAVALERDPATPWYAMARCNLGCAHYLAGAYAEAADPLREAAASSTAFAVTRVRALATHSMVAAEVGWEAQAADLAEAATALADRHWPAGSPHAAPAGTAKGALLMRLGRPAEASELLARVQSSYRRSPLLAGWPVLENLQLLVGALLDLGREQEAQALAAEAADLLASLPADTDRLRVRHARIQRQLSTLTDTTVPLEPLTAREVAVLRLLRSDLSLREVGARLYVSQNTVKTHTRAIYRKLEVGSREEALRRAQEVGLL